jgi:hypothetical protein
MMKPDVILTIKLIDCFFVLRIHLVSVFCKFNLSTQRKTYYWEKENVGAAYL